ncbi:5454_t:CDS:2 [Funneliformis geosporum]|uniref:RING-type E3 ubiquitin transferase n=1 Tax=Funneliformis geosporum TaxID=1117311 RepID=A0A9W4SFX7_9GLOM|nr:5454_t:CDS:2 [Funneliformis geosporum]CAI2165674.1 6306_t:CDS:2 [Funneliformis geosporum]
MYNASNSESQASPVTGPEHSNRGNRRHNNYRRHRGFRPNRHSTPQEQTINNASQNHKVTPTVIPTVTDVPSNSDGDQGSQNENECFICAETVHYYAVPECNHKSCHVCSLRLRALYKSKNCAYCKTERIKVIYTRNPDKKFQEFQEDDIPFFDKKLNVYCEDQEMFDDIMLTLKFNCPDKNCEISCDGWGDLRRHVKKDHHLKLCDICTHNKKIFAHEHTLFTFKGLEKHCRDGDEETGFSGHPECQFCETLFYGDDELYDHCRHSHEECFICVRNGIRHRYYIDYHALEKHFGLEHFRCLNPLCLEKKFIVFESDIDLKAHDVEAHESNFSGQRARREARRIDININFADSYSRDRRRRISRERQERQSDRRIGGEVGGGVDRNAEIDDMTRQTQDLNLDSTTSTTNEINVNARAVRPPPGFGVLSPDEVTGPENELPSENELEIRNMFSISRKEDFPALNASMRVATNNGSVATSGSVSGSGSRILVTPNPPQAPLSESNITNKVKAIAFPPLPSANQSTSPSTSSSTTSTRVKAFSSVIDSEPLSREVGFFQRVNTYLSDNPAKIDEFNSLTAAYNNSTFDASSYIEFLLPLFNKNTGTVGKVVKGLVSILEDEKKSTELLRAWQDHKVKRTADFPALEPVSLHTPGVISNSRSPSSPSWNKPSARVLVIKSSTTRSRGIKTNSGTRVWDQIAAIAESRNKEGKNSTFPSLTTAASNSANDNNVWKGSEPQFVQPPSRNESTSSCTTAFVKGRPTIAENNGFPNLPLTPTSSRSKNDGQEKNVWGQGGAFASIVSDNNQNENDSEDDSSYNDSSKEGTKKKKKQKKTVLFQSGKRHGS